jgi:SAM-dependent methyltransferase
MMKPIGIACDIATRILAVAAVMIALLILTFWPRAIDPPLTVGQKAELLRYYDTEFPQQGDGSGAETAWHTIVTNRVSVFARQYDLAGKKTLEVGSGRGYLQDVVPDYTGLDISRSAKRFYHKPFVVGSATLMPFADDQYDSIWTVFVLEHVDNPEAALNEIRRVSKNGAILFLAPAWDVSPFAANGYPVRPYADFGIPGKVVKAWMPVESYLRALSKSPVRLVRHAAWRISQAPTHLHYQRLTPNYQHYWMADSDAANSLDRYEMAAWFLSRGDECLNCNGLADENDALFIRVHKSDLSARRLSARR